MKADRYAVEHIKLEPGPPLVNVHAHIELRPTEATATIAANDIMIRTLEQADAWAMLFARIAAEMRDHERKTLARG